MLFFNLIVATLALAGTGAADSSLLRRLALMSQEEEFEGDLEGPTAAPTSMGKPSWMNSLPNMYRVSNSDTFEPDFRGEYFEVLSETVQLDYAEVFWRPMDPIAIPVDTTKMHITGIEFDVVRVLEDGSTVPVAEYENYNHHCVINFRGTRTDGSVPEFEPLTHGEMGHSMHGALFKLAETTTESGETIGIQTFIGAEARGSFFYLPEGYAWSLDRPNDIVIEAMLINVGGPGGRCDEASEDCPMPQAALESNGHHYNPLLECPCTDRIVKEIQQHLICPGATCEHPITSMSECLDAARVLGWARPVESATVSVDEAPYGCLLIETREGSKLYFNEKTDATGTCPQYVETDYVLANVDFLKATGADTHAMVSLDDSSNIFVNMTGPADKWFAYGFPSEANSGKMDGALVFVALPGGNVVTRRLGDHSPGEDLHGYRTTVVSSEVVDGQRTVVVQYYYGVTATGAETTSQVFLKVGNLHQRLKTARMDRAPVHIIGAVGRSGTFGYHGSTRGIVQTMLVPHDVAQCIGKNNAEFPFGTINGVIYNPSCNEQLIREHNPICDAQSYPGGQMCCAGGTILLDRDQTPPAHRKDEVAVKLRVYYEDGEKMTEQPEPTRTVYFAPEGNQAEYHIPQHCDARGCVHILETNTTAAAMSIPPGVQARIVGMAGHCHTPMCISQEVWNADTNTLLCKNTMDYGRNMDNVGDELGYITGSSVCMWGDDEGLEDPPVITADTKLYFRKVANSTYAHYGDMAGWLVTVHEE